MCLRHDVGHLVHLRADRLEAGQSLVEIRDPSGNRRQLLGGIDRLVPDVLDGRGHLGQLAATPVELTKHGFDRIALVTGGDDDRVQFIGALLCLGAERQLLEHVRLLSAALADADADSVFDEDDEDRCRRRRKASADGVAGRTPAAASFGSDEGADRNTVSRALVRNCR